MPQVDNTLLFSTLPNASPATPPAGYTQPLGTDATRARIASGKFSLNSNSYENGLWYDNTVLIGNDRRASVVLDAIAVTSGVTAGPALFNSSGTGMVVLCGGSPANFRIFKYATWSISGSVLATNSQVPVLGDDVEIRFDDVTNAFTCWVNGVQLTSFSVTDATFTPTLSAAISRKREATLTSMTSTYFEPYGITSVDSDDSIEIGQSGFTIVTEGFTAQPVATTDNASITVTITGGSSNSWTASANDRTEAGTSPDLPATFTLTLTNGSEVATKTVTLTKRSTETLVTFVSPAIDDSKFLGYWMAAAGHTVDGADFWYVPFGDLVVTESSTCITTTAGSFTGWLRPTLGATAGKTYEFFVTVNEDGVIVDGGGLTTRLIDVSKVPISTIVTRRI